MTMIDDDDDDGTGSDFARNLELGVVSQVVGPRHQHADDNQDQLSCDYDHSNQTHASMDGQTLCLAWNGNGGFLGFSMWPIEFEPEH